MCIIAIKNKGIDYPNDNIIKNMFLSNKDGAGFMYTLDNKVYIKKGFMTLDAFNKAINELATTVNLKDIPMILHFRITTHGGTSSANTHPFPVTESKGLLQKLESTTDLGMAHNGIIDIYQSDKTISDTMQYIIDIVYPLKKLHRYFYNTYYGKALLSHTADSKLAFLNQKGEIATVGDFIEEDGMLYSNSSYKSYKVYTSYSHDKYSKYYDDDYDDTYHEEMIDYRWVMPLLNESVSIRFDNGELDSGEDYFVDSKETLYLYSYLYDCLIPVIADIVGEYEYHYMKLEALPVDDSVIISTKHEAVNGGWY